MRALRVVVDANILAAAAVRPDGWTASEIRNSEAELFAPEAVKGELETHETEFAEKAGTDLPAWRDRVGELLSRLRLVRMERLAGHYNDPLVKSIEKLDPDDAVYVATFLEADADFSWTRDRALHRVLGDRAGPVLPSSDDPAAGR